MHLEGTVPFCHTTNHIGSDDSIDDRRREHRTVYDTKQLSYQGYRTSLVRAETNC